MKKYPKRGSFQDVKLNAEAVGFQIKESYKKARTNIAYSIVKKGCKWCLLQALQNPKESLLLQLI